MHIYYNLQAYEILAVLCSSDQKEFDMSHEVLTGLASLLDNYFGADEFAGILKKAGNEAGTGDHTEALFIPYENLSLEYTNQEILSIKDRVIIYTCIHSWIMTLGLSAHFSGLARRVLAIDGRMANVLDEFLEKDDLSAVYEEMDEVMLLEPESRSGDSLDGDWIKSNQPREPEEEGLHYVEKLEYSLKVLYLDSLKLFFIRCKNKSTGLGKNNTLSQCGWEYAEPGDLIELNGKEYFDYYDLKRRYLITKNSEKLSMRVTDISYSHAPGKSIKKLNLRIESGTLVGILGREGTGKSTILDLLAGEIPSATGSISINGYSYQKELYQLKGMIGYVPEDDMLFNELTVYDNLLYSARLYLGNLSDKEITRQVRQLLLELNLWTVKDKVVGSYQDKQLQPGQRRLLNIALELIRDPKLLIVDNATAPLSLSDSSKIIEVLSAYTFKGRIVITSITQTERKIFQYFDRILLLDDGGIPILYKKVNEVWKLLLKAIGLTKKSYHRPGPNEILELIAQPSTRSGKSSLERYKSSDELYNLLLPDAEEDPQKEDTERKLLPKNILQPPTLDRQYIIFSLRNFKTKLSRTRELLVTIFSAPLLSTLLAIVFRTNFGNSYNFYSNDNIPVFFFVSFLIAAFLGLVLSAREVFRERRIIQKQTYLNISKFSYINSKITYLFSIALVQSFFFIVISHAILQIKGMLWTHWLIYFSVQAFGLLMGLVLSESHRTLGSIYSRTIPIILLLLLLFGGGLVNLQTLSKQKKYTPLIADLAVTRWAYESMMVYQFKNNAYNRHFYAFERDYSSGRLNAYYIIPELREQLEYCTGHYQTAPDSVTPYLESIKKQLERYPKNFDVFPYENVDSLTIKSFNETISADLSDYVEYINLFFYSLYEKSGDEREACERTLRDSLGSNYLSDLYLKNANRAIMEKVTNSASDQVVDQSALPPVLLINQIYQYPYSDYGRTQFFLPEKRINGQIIDTVEFDVSIIWLFNLFLYIILLTSLLSIAYPDKREL